VFSNTIQGIEGGIALGLAHGFVQVVYLFVLVVYYMIDLVLD